MKDVLHARRVLILEDEVIIALDLAESLTLDGFSVVGPYHDTASALAGLEAAPPPNWAILDVNLGNGKTSDAVAERLMAWRVPILFLTGYEVSGSSTLERFPDADKLPKPMEYRQVQDWLARRVNR